MHEVADKKRHSAAELLDQSLRRLEQDIAAWQERRDQLDSQPETAAKVRRRQLLDLERRRLQERRNRLAECRSIAK